MSEAVLWIALACGIGTYTMRVLPLWWRSHRQARATGGAPGRWLQALTLLVQGVGPAAITALLVVSLWPTGGPTAWPPRRALAVLAGLIAVAAVKRWRGGLAAPTLAGALVYALVLATGA
jgi:branched-subunit amino acid transport protein